MKCSTALLVNSLILGSVLAEDALEILLQKYSKADSKKESTTSVTPQINKKNLLSPSNAKISKVNKKRENPKTGVKSYTLQVASFTSEREAQKFIHDDKSFFVTRGEVKNKEVFRVNQGVFQTTREARDYRNSQMKSSYSNLAIVRQLRSDEIENGLKFVVFHQNRKIASVTESKPIHSSRVEEKADQSKRIEPDENSNQSLQNSYDLQNHAIEGDRRNGNEEEERTLEDRGISLGLVYKGDLVRNFSGGIKRKGAYLGNLDITAEMDFGKTMGLRGTKVFLYGLGNHGDTPSEFIGDSFVTSNIEAPATFKLYEAYLQLALDDRSAVVIGLRDLNADYYVTESSGNLINSAFGVSKVIAQTGMNGPSIFPTTSLSINFKYESPTSFYFQTSAFNALAGDPESKYGTHINDSTKEGHLLIWEAGSASQAENERVYKYSLGSWLYSNLVDSIDSSKPQSQSYGFYFLMDHPISENISFFIKHGLASQKVNSFSEGTETGFTFKGILSKRNGDILAIGLIRGKTSEDYRVLNNSQSIETVVEAAYTIKVRQEIELTPDYQWIIHPGLDKSIKNAQVAGLRFRIEI